MRLPRICWKRFTLSGNYPPGDCLGRPGRMPRSAPGGCRMIRAADPIHTLPFHRPRCFSGRCGVAEGHDCQRIDATAHSQGYRNGCAHWAGGRRGSLADADNLKDLKLYNTADFGGALCLRMPELHGGGRSAVDEDGQSSHHTPTAEFGRNRRGARQKRANQFRGGAIVARGGAWHESRPSRSDQIFWYLHETDRTLGTMRWSRLSSTNQRVYQFGIKNQVFRGVKSEADLAVLVALASANNTNFNMSDLMGSLIGR